MTTSLSLHPSHVNVMACCQILIRQVVIATKELYGTVRGNVETRNLGEVRTRQIPAQPDPVLIAALMRMEKKGKKFFP